MISLNPTEALALGNLARKHDGFDVGYIRIAEARALTEMGFAQRQPSGWRITEAGLAHFKQFVSSKDSPAEIGVLYPRKTSHEGKQGQAEEG